MRSYHGLSLFLDGRRALESRDGASFFDIAFSSIRQTLSMVDGSSVEIHRTLSQDYETSIGNVSSSRSLWIASYGLLFQVQESFFWVYIDHFRSARLRIDSSPRTRLTTDGFALIYLCLIRILHTWHHGPTDDTD